MSLFSHIISLFSTKKCCACSKPGHFFCPQCIEKIKIYTPYCFCCKESSQAFHTHKNCGHKFSLSQVVVLFPYTQSGIKKSLHAGKYYKNFPVYKELIVSQKELLSSLLSPKESILIPIPMHFFRKWKRGYNHSDKIAKYLSTELDIPLRKNILKKQKYSGQQSKLSRDKRLENIKESFSVQKNSSDRNKIVYLVDDVVSTGATLLEATRVLKKAGFQDIRAIVLSSN